MLRLVKVYAGVTKHKMGYVILDKGKEVYRYVSDKYSTFSEEMALVSMVTEVVTKLNYLFDMNSIDRSYEKAIIVVDDEYLIDCIKSVKKVRKNEKEKDLLFKLAFSIASSRYMLEFLCNDSIVKAKLFGEESKKEDNFSSILEVLK